MKNTTSILLIIAILVVVNVLSKQIFHRFDLTEGQQFTLSKATENIVENLSEPVTIKAYFSNDMPTEMEKAKQDFKDLLLEYANVSKGMVEYQFINPGDDSVKEQEAMQNGVQPLVINVREKDAMTQKKVYMGAVMQVGEQKDVIPAIVSGAGMEYALTTGIKKISVVDKPSIGLIQGHGEPSLSELQQVYQSLSILYNVENLDLNTEPEIAPRFRAVAMIAPKDSIPAAHFAKMDGYLSKGGKMLVAINRVDANLQQLQGIAVNTGLETWLSTKGVLVEPAFAIDQSCGAVTSMQTKQVGFMTINQPVQIQFPYLPIVTQFTEHPITKGLEQVVFQFASPLQFAGDTSKTFTPIATTTEVSGSINAPTQFDIQKQWTQQDFPLSRLPLAGVLEGNLGGANSLPSKLVVVGDGDFATSGSQGRGQGQDNISLMVNSIDWLSDDTGLIDLRTKGIASRPIDETYLGEDNAGKRNMIKYLNFGVPILLLLIYGFIRSQRQRNLRVKRMEEQYN